MAKYFPSLAAVDLGSSKVSALLCEIAPHGLEVIGFGEADSHGLRKGSVVNIDAVAKSVEEALNEAQALARREPDFIVVGLNGAHIESFPSQGMLPIRDREIQAADVKRVLEAASAVQIPIDREVIQVIPQEFVVDGQEGIHEVEGMYGRRLEARIEIVTGAVTSLQNIRRALQKANVKAEHFLVNSLAAARACLSEEEKEAGVCVVDIGAATTEICVFQDSMLKWMKSLPMAGLHLTSDLAVGLKTNITDAEKIKKQYGCSLRSSKAEKVQIPGFGDGEDRFVSRSLISSILQARAEELLELVRNELARQGQDESLPSGLVLTGGASQLKGLNLIAQQLFSLPVRTGQPSRLGGLSEMISSSSHSSIVGLVQMAFEQSDDLKVFSSFYEKKGLKKIQAQFSRWVKDFF